MATAIKPLTDWSAAQASPWNTVNANSDALNLRASGSVKDKDLTSPPGSPSDKDAYIVGASATGAWAGEDGNIAVYDSTAAGWDFYAPYEGLIVWVDDEDYLYAYDGSAWAKYPARIYDFGCAFGTEPTVDTAITRLTTARTLTIPANFAGSAGNVDTNPANTFYISVRDDGVEIGTITVSTSGTFTFATTGGTAQEIAAGSLIEFVSQGQGGSPLVADGTIAGLSATIAATVK